MSAQDDSPHGFVWACRVVDLVRDRVRFRATHPDGTALLLTRAGGQLYCVGSTCPHGHANLSAGDIEDTPPVGSCLGIRDVATPSGGLCVRCPKHHGRFGGGLYFSFENGAGFTGGPSDAFSASWKIPVYDVITRGEDVHVSIHPRGQGMPKLGAQLLPRSQKQPGWGDAQLLNREQINNDTHLFTFRFSAGCPGLGEHAPAIMWHVGLSFRSIEREYTPLSCWDILKATGEVALLIKLYADGAMSRSLGELRPGMTVSISEPRATIVIPALEDAVGGRSQQSAQLSLGFISGGTGVLPAWQLVEASMAHAVPRVPDQQPSMSALSRRWGRQMSRNSTQGLSCEVKENGRRWGRHSKKIQEDPALASGCPLASGGARTASPISLQLLQSSGPAPEDLLLLSELQESASRRPDVLSEYVATLTSHLGVHKGPSVACASDQISSSHEASWGGLRGRIDLDMVRQCMPAPGPRSIIVLSGPSKMLVIAARLLKHLGHASDSVHILDA